MQECLGINITDKLIRYAKVKKDNNDYTVESLGIKFYNNIIETLDQIITETNSKNIPISCDLSNEKYYYFNIFSLTNKSYLDKAVKTEFESYCTENHLNNNVYDGKYIYTKSMENPDQSKVIYIYDSQADVSERLSFLGQNRLSTLVPLPTTLPNLIKTEKNKNAMIINIDEHTTVTTIINQAIYNVDLIEDGMKQIIDSINERENSYSKAYEICQNTTIYTMDTNYSSMEENEYLKYIVPTLYKIVEQVQDLKETYKTIDNIYITGMGAIINNVDLYFKEYFKDSKVEILKPYFLESQMNMNINIKDYIEANSAIALAMQGLGAGIQSLNFLGKTWKSELIAFLKSDIKFPSKNKKEKNPKESKFKLKLDTNLKGKFDKIETILMRNIVTAVMVIIVYSIASNILVNQINKKIAETNDVNDYITQQLQLANDDDSKITGKTLDYQKYTTNLQNISSSIRTTRGRKNQITTLLNKIVYNIPQLVNLESIDNTEVVNGENTIQHISMKVQSEKYEQIAYFKAKLINANILENITSTEGEKNGSEVTVTIEGDLKTY